MTHSAEWIGRSPAIARVNNAEAGRWEDTDWEQIVLLYDMPLHWAPSRSPASTMRSRRVPRGRLGELRDEGHHNLALRQ